VVPIKGASIFRPLFTRPYTEDVVARLVREAGAENMLFDSGSLHGEGLAERTAT